MDSAQPTKTWCAACGLPGHRFGTNEGAERYDAIACINCLRSLLEDARDMFIRGDYETTDRERWTSWMQEVERV